MPLMSFSRFTDQAALWYCRLGFAGLSPVMPGTCGTLVAAVLAPFVFLPLSVSLRLGVLGLVFVSGALAATRAERLLGQKDPGQVVVDELLGLWITILPFPTVTLPQMLAAVVLFRIFDMAKPWPVSASETWLPDGWGVMLDDAVAGGLALGCLAVIRWAQWL